MIGESGRYRVARSLCLPSGGIWGAFPGGGRTAPYMMMSLDMTSLHPGCWCLTHLNSKQEKSLLGIHCHGLHDKKIKREALLLNALFMGTLGSPVSHMKKAFRKEAFLLHAFFARAAPTPGAPVAHAK